MIFPGKIMRSLRHNMNEQKISILAPVGTAMLGFQGERCHRVARARREEASGNYNL
jgi:transcription elongation GreA/GreB family factor